MRSSVLVSPEIMATSASDLAGVGSSIRAANAAAAASTTRVVAAAQDEVSAAIAGLFSSYGQEHQALRRVGQGAQPPQIRSFDRTGEVLVVRRGSETLRLRLRQAGAAPFSGPAWS